MKNILIATGGTGGHIYPAVVLGRELENQFGVKVFWTGTKKGICKEIFTHENCEYELFDLEGLSREFSRKTFAAFWKLLKTFFESFALLKRIKPDIVVGMGGYASCPILLASVLTNIPTVIHEQNVVPGLTNRFLDKLVDQTTVAFSQACKYFKRAVITGNPVRLAIKAVSKEDGRKNLGLKMSKPVLFILGGSQGSHRINEVFKAALKLLAEKNIDVQFIWITGEKDWDELNKFCRGLRFQYYAKPFLHNIEYAYAASDLIISRSGALTISEIAASKRPAILIPFPYAANNHQYYNAKVLEEKGSAIIVLENELTEEKLVDMIIDLFNNKQKLIDMAEKNKGVYQLDAEKLLSLSVLAVMKK